MPCMKNAVTIVLAVGLFGSGSAAAELLYTKPGAWTAAATASSMRVAQFVVPGAKGDAADAELKSGGASSLADYQQKLADAQELVRRAQAQLDKGSASAPTSPPVSTTAAPTTTAPRG